MLDSVQRTAKLPVVLAAQMGEAMSVAGRTKRSAARLAIVEAIRKGTLEPGDLLPSETQLTKILGVSLGTVQAAMRQLQQMGTIIRRRGDGSRVASNEPLSRDVWHFRFSSKQDGTPLRMMDERVWIDRIEETGDWAEHLGERPCYVRLRRRITMQDHSPVGAEMFLDAESVPGLDSQEPTEFDMINIRPYLEERFGIVTASAEHDIRVCTLEPTVAADFDLTPLADMFEIHARTFTQERAPVYFQRIFAPVSSCILTF